MVGMHNKVDVTHKNNGFSLISESRWQYDFTRLVL